MAEFDPQAILKTLMDHGVDFVVIGASAAILQGAPLRPTLDVDIAAAATGANRRRLAAALAEMGAKLRLRDGDEPVEAPLDERMLANVSVATLITRYGPFDVLFDPAGAPAYAELRKRSVEVAPFGIALRAARVEDIVAMKRAAGREKDAAHLPVLLEFLEEQEGRS